MVSLESLEHVDQRRWWLYKVWAPSKIIIFHGAQIDTVLTGSRENVMESKFRWGIWRMRTTRRRLLQVGKHQNQQGGASRKFGTCGPKKMVTLESLGPIENYNFRWGSNRRSFGPNQKEGYRGDCFGEASLYPGNMHAPRGGGKTSTWKKMVSLESFGPSQNYNFSWGLNWLTWSRKNSMDAVCALHHISTSGLIALGYIVMCIYIYIDIDVYIYI